MVQIVGQCRGESLSKRERWLVGEAAEHYMRHCRQLTLDRIPDVGVVVAMACGPPGCNAIDELAPVSKLNPAPARANDGGGRIYPFHLRVWQPDVLEPCLVPRRRIIQTPELR